MWLQLGEKAQFWGSGRTWQMPSHCLRCRIHPHTSQHLHRGSSTSPCMSQVWGLEGHIRLCKAVAVTSSGIMGCPELEKALEPTLVWRKQPWLAADMEPNWQVPRVTWNHNKQDEWEVRTGKYWFNPPKWRNTEVQWGISLCPALTTMLRDRSSVDFLGGPVPLQISSKVWTGSSQPSNTAPNCSITTCQLEIIHCSCSLEDSSVFWPWKREVKTTTSSLHSQGLLVSLQGPGSSVSPWLWHRCGCHRETPRNENTLVWWGVGFAGEQTTEGMSLWRRAEEPLECPFGEEQNPLGLLVFLPPSCTSYRVYHPGAVGYEQPSPAKAVELLFFWELVGTTL